MPADRDDAPPGMVTLADVARVVGASKSTVCRALGDRPGVAEETRVRVREAAARLGYRPDPILTGLARRRWERSPERYHRISVAMVGVAATRHLGGDRLGLREAVGRRADELGVSLGCFEMAEHPRPEALGRMLHHRGYDGVVADVAQPACDWRFEWERFAVVTIGYDHPAHRFHSVCSDWAAAVRLAAERLRARGCRRVGFIHFAHGQRDMDDLLEGAMRVESARQEGGPVEILRYPQQMTDWRPFRAWLERERPDGVVDGNRVAVWWAHDLREQIAPVPPIVSLLGPSVAGDVRAAGIEHDYARQGVWAFETVLHLVQMGRRGFPASPVRTVVEVGWREAPGT